MTCRNNHDSMTSVKPLSPNASCTSLGQAPTIHISPSKTKYQNNDGHTNEAFEMDDECSELSNAAMHAQFVAECGFASESAAATKHSIRRESGQTITSVQNTLRVPGVSQCLASTSQELDEEILDPSDELSGSGAMPLGSASNSFLHPSASSPTKSMRSNWSELINLGRKDSIGSYHSDEDEAMFADTRQEPRETVAQKYKCGLLLFSPQWAVRTEHCYEFAIKGFAHSIQQPNRTIQRASCSAPNSIYWQPRCKIRCATVSLI